MRRPRRPLAVLLAIGTAFALTPTASAQEALTPKFSLACMGFCPGGGPPTSERQFLDSAEYPAGGTIRINLTVMNECGVLEATSAGFTAPAKLTQKQGTGGYQLTGVTRAAATPGRYFAEIRCTWALIVTQFTVKVAPPVRAPKPKPPIVKPAGSPDTGGGGTA
ncbi:hypothetical protein ABZ345_21635 [Lentzea sp. NPDC005914]|uniref:hypothetical protein n=1 Tax=Lentzea sp. NPDC005914 TaxID=3154572 RepID=UPI0033F0B984